MMILNDFTKVINSIEHMVRDTFLCYISEGELSPDIEAAIRACWEPLVGEEFEVVVSSLVILYIP